MSAIAVCALDQLAPERGGAVLVGDTQIALFRLAVDGLDMVFAIDHQDPFSGANVLARGIVGSVDGRDYVASPLHKQRFDLRTGECLDVPGVMVAVWPTTIIDGIVHLVA